MGWWSILWTGFCIFLLFALVFVVIKFCYRAPNLADALAASDEDQGRHTPDVVLEAKPTSSKYAQAFAQAEVGIDSDDED